MNKIDFKDAMNSKISVGDVLVRATGDGDLTWSVVKEFKETSTEIKMIGVSIARTSLSGFLVKNTKVKPAEIYRTDAWLVTDDSRVLKATEELRKSILE